MAWKNRKRRRPAGEGTLALPTDERLLRPSGSCEGIVSVLGGGDAIAAVPVDAEIVSLSRRPGDIRRIRIVRPYPHSFRTFAKGRWVGRTVLDVYTAEFGSYPEVRTGTCASAVAAPFPDASPLSDPPLSPASRALTELLPSFHSGGPHPGLRSPRLPPARHPQWRRVDPHRPPSRAGRRRRAGLRPRDRYYVGERRRHFRGQTEHASGPSLRGLPPQLALRSDGGHPAPAEGEPPHGAPAGQAHVGTDHRGQEQGGGVKARKRDFGPEVRKILPR
mmetsp:Transcript_40192/g.78535  ORF Transcript_40192/g.78535 Transcript_40192/m.78535 type:complete len:276 (+) Transcript_40192:49-876(+)